MFYLTALKSKEYFKEFLVIQKVEFYIAKCNEFQCIFQHSTYVVIKHETLKLQLANKKLQVSLVDNNINLMQKQQNSIFIFIMTLKQE